MSNGAVSQEVDAVEIMANEARELGWTAEATEVLEQACEYYGGSRVWQGLRCVRLVPERLTGMLPYLKGVGKTFFLPKRIEICPHQRQTTFVDYPRDGHSGIFDNG